MASKTELLLKRCHDVLVRECSRHLTHCGLAKMASLVCPPFFEKVKREDFVQGDKVKLTMRFKGREMEFQSLGKEMFTVCPLYLTVLASSTYS